MDETVKKRFDFAGFIKSLPVATTIIGGFFVLILVISLFYDFSMANLIGDSIQRFGMWGLFVLAMVPSIQSGTGPNFALPVGICAGLLSMITSIEFGFTGMSLVLAAAGMAIVIGTLFGYAYGYLMNAVKGSEMAIATYTGFAITMLFCMVWMAVPFTSPNIGWFLGDGLRNLIALEPVGADKILDNFLRFSIFGVDIPTGMLLVVFVACLFVWLFFRSKTGVSISAVGANPMFATAAGLNVDRSRIIANILSTVLAALGVIVYYQSFTFIQIYDAPLMMAFPAVAAVLVGGATAQRAKVINVIVGAFLFQGLLTTAPAVIDRIITADIVDPVRMTIQNGVILYALTQLRGGAK
jgi:simple sugar transport system permease protein